VKISALLIVSCVIALLVVQIGSWSTIAHEDFIVLPGTEIEETIFAEIASNETDSTIYSANWTIVSDSPYRLQLTLPDTTYDYDSLIEKARDSVNETLMKHLMFKSDFRTIVPMIPSYIENVTYRYPFVNETFEDVNLVVSVYVNAISGRIVGYNEYWSEGWSIPVDLTHLAPHSQNNMNISSLNATQIAKNFLLKSNYSIPYGMRYIRTYLTMNPTNDDYDTYEVSLKAYQGKLFPEKKTDGIRIWIDITTGRIIKFSYLLVQAPRIDIDSLELISEYVAERMARDSVHIRDFNSIAEMENSYLRITRASYTRDSLFAIAWSFEYSIHMGNYRSFGEIGEIDASTGEYLYPGFYRQQTFEFNDVMSFPISIIFLGLISSTSVTILFMQWRKKSV